MTTTLEARPADRFLSRFTDWFEMPDLLRMWERTGWVGHVRIEEERRDDALVVRAEIPGIDPEKDLEIEVADDMLKIHGERREEHREETEGKVVSEFHYGSFSRLVALPKGVTGEDVTATYRDGILEVTVPMPKEVEKTAKKVAISRS